MSLGKFFGLTSSSPEKTSSNGSNHPFSKNPKLSSQENLDKFQKLIVDKKQGLHTRIHTQSDQLTQFRIQNESVFLGKVFDTLEGSKLGVQIIFLLIFIINFLTNKDFKANTIEEIEREIGLLSRIDDPSIKSRLDVILGYQNLAKNIKSPNSNEEDTIKQLIQIYSDNQKHLEQVFGEIKELLYCKYLDPEGLEEELKKDFHIEVPPDDYDMFDKEFQKHIDQQLQAYQDYKSKEIEAYRKLYTQTHESLSKKSEEIRNQIFKFHSAIHGLREKLSTISKNKIDNLRLENRKKAVENKKKELQEKFIRFGDKIELYNSQITKIEKDNQSPIESSKQCIYTSQCVQNLYDTFECFRTGKERIEIGYSFYPSLYLQYLNSRLLEFGDNQEDFGYNGEFQKVINKCEPLFTKIINKIDAISNKIMKNLLTGIEIMSLDLEKKETVSDNLLFASIKKADIAITIIEYKNQ